ncbi:endosialidase catalytic beta-propeller domain-containing protein, partial [Mannheimia haemolytica]|nr:endosialidase catalytic beta-propeller domain-containing protein [Mannheimia haemolytica]
MYALDNKSGIPQMPKIPEVFSTSPLWFTEGRDGNTPSYPGAHWFNIVQAELLNILKAAGVEPEKHSLDQLAQALKILAGQAESIDDLRQFEPVKDRQVVFVKAYHTGSDKGGGYFVSDFADTVSADNSVTLFVTANGKRWKRVYSTLNIFDFGVKLDSVNNDAIKRLQAWQEPVLGLGNVIPASSRIVPASHISQVAYRFNGIDYLSEDYYKVDLSQITRTGYYTAWTQDKAFVHNGVMYAPFMLASRHSYDDLRIAWVRSFDNGNTWTTPEILMDYHPQNPTLGWHCFSMGVVG